MTPARLSVVAVQSGLSFERLFDLVPVEVGSRTTSRLAAAIALTAILWFLHGLANLIVGYRQKREGKGTWKRLIIVAAVIGAMQTLPVCVGLILVAGELSWVNDNSLTIALPILWLFGGFTLTLVMSPPQSLIRAAKQSLLMEDARFLQRVDELASRMRLSTPVVRMWRSGGSGELQAMAFVGGLAAPILIVADGILHRLTEDERDSIIGHELAHLTNGSLWFLLSTFPLAGLAALLTACFTTPAFGLATGFASYLLLQRPISRHFEFDCDRRSAEVLGFRSMVSALAKIHAAHPVRNHGWLSYLVYAIATHPSRVERLSALAEAAPKDDQPDVSWDQSEVRRRKRTARFAMICGCVLLCSSLLWKCVDPSTVFPVLLLGLIVITPVSAMLIAFRRATRRQRKRMPSAWFSPMKLTAAICLLAFIGFFQQMRNGRMGEQPSEPSGLALLCFLIWIISLLVVCFLALKGIFGRRSRLRKKCAVLMQTHEFAEVVALAERFPKPFARDGHLRYTLAYSRALSGDRATAVGELIRLINDVPKLYDAAVLLAVLAIDDGRPEKALPLCEKLTAALPQDPDPPTIKASALNALRRFDEAEAAVRKALAIDPEAGYAYAVRAAIEWERGNLEAGEAALRQSEEYVPGTAYLQYLRAEHALRMGDMERARAEVQKVVIASAANPFALLQKRVLRLVVDVGLESDVAE